MTTIPDPELIGDLVFGSLVSHECGAVLALGALPSDLPADALMRPPSALTIRYAIEYLNEIAAIVPGLFAAEYGAMLVGREAWDYAMQHNNLHPRADVVGLRSDGDDDQVMLRALDFGRPVRVLAYASPDARVPLAELSAYWDGPGAPGVPDLLAAHLPALDRLLPLDSPLTDTTR
ncbi:MAG: hypothetical protein JW910_14250 [Anaerolineae bacterium]|nr:hypothetical protein [Anaerolineae bacterium]